MRARLVCFCTTILFLSHAGGSTFAVASQQAQVSGLPFSGLTLKLTSPLGRCLPLEPLPVTIRLENKTAASVPGHRLISPEPSLFTIQVSPPGKPFESFETRDPCWMPFLSARPSESLPPGFRESVTGYLYCGHNPVQGKTQYFFPTPGTYRIRVVLTSRDGSSVLESNVLELQVAAPGIADAEAYAFLRSTPHKAFLMFGGGMGLSMAIARQQPAFADLTSFAERFPESRYASYANFSLGMAHSVSSDRADQEKALKLFEKARTQGFPMAAEATCRMVNSCIQTEELEKAKEHLRSLSNTEGELPCLHDSWNNLVTAMRLKGGLCNVRVTVKVDWSRLEKAAQGQLIGLAFEPQDLGYLPFVAYSLKNPSTWKEARSIRLPPGTYRVSLRRDERLTSFKKPVIVMEGLRVTTDMELLVEVGPEDLGAMERTVR